MTQNPDSETPLNIISAAEREAASKKNYDLKINEVSKKVIEFVEMEYQKRVQTSSSLEIELYTRDINKYTGYQLSTAELNRIIMAHYGPKGYDINYKEYKSDFITIYPKKVEEKVENSPEACCQLL